MEEGKDFVICQICRKRLKAISNVHLKIHKLTIEEYKKIFPDTLIICAKTIKKLSLKNKKLQGEKKEKWENSLFKKGESPWNKGLTKETDERVKKYADNKPDSVNDSISKAKIKFYQEHPEAIMKGENHPMFGKNHSKKSRQMNSDAHKLLWENPVFVKRMFMSFIQKPTKPEKELKSLLDVVLPKEYEYNGIYGCGVSIGRKIPDFVNVKGKKKVIEMNGEYWHKGENPQDRIDLFKEYGYDCLIIYDFELQDKRKVINKILKFHKLPSLRCRIQSTLGD